MASPSSAGIRLGPEADKYFAPVTSDPAALAPAFDPFGGVPQAPPSPPPPGHDPFVAQPVAPMPAELLGKPQPWRVLAPIAAGILVAILVASGVVLVVARSDPASLEIISVPEGAEVVLDGRRVPGVTPLSIRDVEVGRPYRVRLTYPGYEPHEAEITTREGPNRRVFLLDPIRVTMRIETSPPGAQVWVDNMLRGHAPLTIPGLAAGQTVHLRSSAPGRGTVTRHVTLDASDRNPTVRLELPPQP